MEHWIAWIVAFLLGIPLCLRRLLVASRAVARHGGWNPGFGCGLLGVYFTVWFSVSVMPEPNLIALTFLCLGLYLPVGLEWLRLHEQNLAAGRPLAWRDPLEPVSQPRLRLGVVVGAGLSWVFFTFDLAMR